MLLAGSLYTCADLTLSNAAAALLPYMQGWFCAVHRSALSSMIPGNRPMSSLGWSGLCMLPHMLQLDTPHFSLTDARYLPSLARRRRALKDQLGCVRSLRASVRYFTAAGMSSKPRLLTANLVNLQTRSALSSTTLFVCPILGSEANSPLHKPLMERAHHAHHNSIGEPKP